MAIDLQALREKHAALSKPAGGGDNDFVNNFFQLKIGTNIARILPAKDDDTQFFAETKIHRVPDGTDAEGKPKVKNYHCRKIHDENCPLCDAYYSLWKPPYGSKEDEALARIIKPRSRFYMNAVDKESGEVKILSVGVIIFNKILAALLDEDFGDITDLENGYDFKIVKIMDGQWPKYDQSAPRPKQTPAGTKKEIATFMDSLHDTQALVKLEDYDDLKLVAQNLLPSPSGSMSMPESTEQVGDDDYLEKMSK